MDINATTPVATTYADHLDFMAALALLGSFWIKADRMSARWYMANLDLFAIRSRHIPSTGSY